MLSRCTPFFLLLVATFCCGSTLTPSDCKAQGPNRDLRCWVPIVVSVTNADILEAQEAAITVYVLEKLAIEWDYNVTMTSSETIFMDTVQNLDGTYTTTIGGKAVYEGSAVSILLLIRDLGGRLF